MPSLIEVEREQRRKANLELYRLAGLPVIGGGSPEGDPPDDDPDTDPPDDPIPETMDTAAKAALTKEREARKQAAKEARDAKAALATLQAEKDAADAAKAQAEAEDAKKKGEWEKLATDRETQLNATTGERDTLKQQLDTLIAAIKPDVDAQWKALPEEVTELYEGDGDDVLAKRAHITKHRKLIDRLSTQQDQAKQAASFGRTPNPNGKKQDEFTPVAPVRF